MVGSGEFQTAKAVGSPVTPAYRPPNAFRGGTIERVIVDVSGDVFVDHEKEVAAWLARD